MDEHLASEIIKLEEGLVGEEINSVPSYYHLREIRNAADGWLTLRNLTDSDRARLLYLYCRATILEGTEATDRDLVAKIELAKSLAQRSNKSELVVKVQCDWVRMLSAPLWKKQQLAWQLESYCNEQRFKSLDHRKAALEALIALKNEVGIL